MSRTMSNVIDFSRKRASAAHDKKEERADALKDRFEQALPSPGSSPKEKLLGIFKRNKSGKRKPTPPPKKDGW